MTDLDCWNLHGSGFIGFGMARIRGLLMERGWKIEEYKILMVKEIIGFEDETKGKLSCHSRDVNSNPRTN